VTGVVGLVAACQRGQCMVGCHGVLYLYFCYYFKYRQSLNWTTTTTTLAPSSTSSSSSSSSLSSIDYHCHQYRLTWSSIIGIIPSLFIIYFSAIVNQLVPGAPCASVERRLGTRSPLHVKTLYCNSNIASFMYSILLCCLSIVIATRVSTSCKNIVL
jgi:hypothetical protein